MTHEEWRPVPGHPEFEASSIGRIRTATRKIVFSREGKPQQCFIRGRVLAPHLTWHRYHAISYKSGGKRPKSLVHRLVGFAFVPGYREGLTINHKNGNKLDNRPSNLEWVTLEENTSHEWATGLVDLRGEKHPSAKLSNAQVVDIRASSASHSDLAAAYGVSASLIYLIRSGRKRLSG